MKNRTVIAGDNWKTPPDLLHKLDEEFDFDFDPCPYSEFEPKFDGLKVSWGKSNFVNPPYSRKLKDAFVRKGIEEWKSGKTVVFLLPVSTSTSLFHDHILPNNPEIRFLRGRVSFHGRNTYGEWVTNKKGMHDSMIVIFRSYEDSRGVKP